MSINKGEDKKCRKNYLILGGTPKSGTTSLFRYLSHHPQICPANRKETYFFARDFDYKGVCNTDETREGFDSYFSHCGKPYAWHLEGTPYTLYSKDSALRIDKILPDAKIMFILRNPIARLFSDYNFHMLRKHPYVHGPFESYVRFHLNNSRHHPNLIELGCYIEYLKKFKSFFKQNKVHIVFFEGFIKNPLPEMKKICSLLDISPEYYDNYLFNPQNPTIHTRVKQIHKVIMWLEPLLEQMRARTLSKPVLNRNFEKIMHSTKSMYYRLNHRESEVKEVITSEVLSLLSEFYRPYNQALATEIGQPLPWA